VKPTRTSPAEAIPVGKAMVNAAANARIFVCMYFPPLSGFSQDRPEDRGASYAGSAHESVEPPGPTNVMGRPAETDHPFALLVGGIILLARCKLQCT
jgi:hypothetical protein